MVVLVCVCLLPVAACLLLLAISVSDYGAHVDYPEAASVPSSARVLVVDDGADDDEPMRARTQVIEFRGGAGALREFYRAEYPGSQGWHELKPYRQGDLCLLRAAEGYDEIIDVERYGGSRVARGPGRYLVTSSRSENTARSSLPAPGTEINSTGDICGAAGMWIPMDLVR